MNPASLRWKIAALVTLAATVVAAVVGLLVHRATWQRALDLGESRAEVALDRSLAGGTDVVSVGSLPDALAAQVRPGGGRVVWYGLDHRDEPWVWAVQPRGGQAVSVQISMGSDLLGLHALDRDMIKAALLALAGVVPLSMLAAELPNRRLRRMARVARRIADGDLAARTDARGRDEIAEIGAGLNSMAAGLQRRLLAEQRFTADVAHDLRTPLMGLLTAGQLLPEGEATDLVRDRIGVLRGLVDDLLEISHLDAPGGEPDLQPVPLAGLVRESLRRVDVSAELRADEDTTAVTDARRLERIVANLLLNARTHGAAPITITVRPGRIVIRDHGPGLPPDLLTLLNEGEAQRFRTGRAERGGGHGLGLTIVLGHARVIGATLRFANPADGGASVTVTLPDR
ncbi:Signal transduction histidine kinase [Nonomuraea solani]|uniref:Signal transduction histidine-protein kinase/phosphatase MprB n=1 Tax=Nonomuraea solani TaxID=1144553 RepID=A0A1H6DTN2_9ACTN|nr:HAMP domain-containing sensor histidine kinase [Nonomuraea solani]SEG88707.1 Signal transduction histidine kinase [Nonomuraea solani]